MVGSTKQKVVKSAATTVVEPTTTARKISRGAIGNINNHMTRVRREYLAKDRKSRTSAARAILTT
jgi:hypothetical protein